MGILAERALRSTHVGTAAPKRQLLIDGEEFRFESASAEFDPRSGGSGMTFNVRDSLEGLEDATVTLMVGYGDRMVPYFVGMLQDPSDLASGSASAFGPFKLMADQAFGEQVRYQGVSVGYFFRDLGRRAGYGNGVLEVMEADSFDIEMEVFTEETRLGEAAKSVADPAGFVFYDRPGFRRAAMPEPRPGSSGKSKAHITERNYSPKGFKTRETREGHYSKVVVFRRNDSGGYDVRQEVPVPNRGRHDPPENRIYYVPEFVGNAAAGRQKAYELATRLAYGALDFDLSGMWINPELELWDTITVERTERRRRDTAGGAGGKRGKWLATYQCLIHGGLSLEVSKDSHHMPISGSALKIAEIKLPDPIRLTLRHALSAGVVLEGPRELLAGLKPDVNLKPDRGFKPDVDLQPDVGLKPRRGLKPDKAHY